MQNKIFMDAYAAAIAYQKKVDGSFDAWITENKNKFLNLPKVSSEAVENMKQELMQGKLMHSLATYNEDKFLPSVSPV